jgi:hypothetical protein
MATAVVLNGDVPASFKSAAPLVLALMAWRVLWTPKDEHR